MENSKPMFPPNTCACGHKSHLGQCEFCPPEEPCIIYIKNKNTGLFEYKPIKKKEIENPVK